MACPIAKPVSYVLAVVILSSDLFDNVVLRED